MINSSGPRPGVWAASLTPMRPDLSVDHTALFAHCSKLLSCGCDGVVILGSTGEAASFSVEERIDLLDRLLAAGLPPECLLVGTGCCALPDTVRLTAHATAAGVSGVLVIPPYYYKAVSDEGIFEVYDALINQVADDRLRIILYHFPRMAGVGFSFSLIDRLIEAYPETVAGIKDSSGDWERINACCGRFPGIRVYSGTERFLRDILWAGGAGCISASVNLTAPLAQRVFEDFRCDSSVGLQERLSDARSALESLPFVPGLKAIMAKTSGRPEWLNMRPPMMPLPPVDAEILDAMMKELEKLIWRRPDSGLLQ